MSTFGSRLREARKAQKMSQKQLAANAKLSQTTISDIERGRNTTSSETVALAQALGVLAEWLATGRKPMTISERDEDHAQKAKSLELSHSTYSQTASEAAQSCVTDMTTWPFSPIEPNRFYSLSEKGQVWALSQFQAAIVEAERLFGSQRGNVA